mmetsp:Transcript_116157/g.189182  ORF Transcript_116157/g.189182 Transcript_116157/m.189182 type:complete len:201 (+) Transcript_116157:136-738(+)
MTNPVAFQHAALVVAVVHFVDRITARLSSNLALGVDMLLVYSTRDSWTISIQGAPSFLEIHGCALHMSSNRYLLIDEPKLVLYVLALRLGLCIHGCHVPQFHNVVQVLAFQPPQAVAVGVVYNINAVTHMGPREANSIIANFDFGPICGTITATHFGRFAQSRSFINHFSPTTVFPIVFPGAKIPRHIIVHTCWKPKGNV